MRVIYNVCPFVWKSDNHRGNTSLLTCTVDQSDTVKSDCRPTIRADTDLLSIVSVDSHLELPS